MASRMPNRTRSMSQDDLRASELDEAPEMHNEAEDDSVLDAMEGDDADRAPVAIDNYSGGTASVAAVGRRPMADYLPRWIPSYVRDSIIELSKVTWPSRREAANLTTIVIIFSVLFAAVFGLLDIAFQNGLAAILSK